MALSLREMTLRHPRAFSLVAAAPVFESPVLEYAARIRDLHDAQGIDQRRFIAMWSVCDAFLTGFMVMLAQAAVRAASAVADEAAPVASAKEIDQGLAEELGAVLSEEAFLRDLEIVLAGLRASGLIEKEPA